MQSVTNPLQACTEIFYKPNGVFAALKTANNWSWIPFFFVVVMVLLPQYTYLNTVDFDWYKDIVVAAQSADASPADQQMIRDSLTEGSMMLFGLVIPTIMLILVNLIVALIYHLATQSDSENVQGFTDWYGFCWWIAMPVVLSSLLTIIVIATASTNQIPPTSLQVTSLAYWLGLDMTHNWFGWCATIKLESFWSIYLAAAGISQWTSMKGTKAWLVAALPSLLLWVLWGVINLFG